MTPKPTQAEMQKLHEAAVSAWIECHSASFQNRLIPGEKRDKAECAFRESLTRLFTVDGESARLETVRDAVYTAWNEWAIGRVRTETLWTVIAQAAIAATYTPSGEKKDDGDEI